MNAIVQRFYRNQTLRWLAMLFFVVLACQIQAGKKQGGSSSGNGLRKKRIMSEIRDIYRNMISMNTPFNVSNEEIGIRLSPVPGNLLEFHFSFTGIEGSAFDGGIYHGRILLHPDYPRKAPAICVLTPTGRWEVGKDICLSASAHHQETWDPLWNLRTLVMGLRGHILTQPREIGAISTTVEHQRKLASLSRDWSCPICGVSHADLVPGANTTTSKTTTEQHTSEHISHSMVSDVSVDENMLIGNNHMMIKKGTFVRININSNDIDNLEENISNVLFDTDSILANAESHARKEILQVTKKYRSMRRAEAREQRERSSRLKLLRTISMFVVSILTFCVLQIWSNYGQGMGTLASGSAGKKTLESFW